MFGEPAESPIWAVGELPRQVRLPFTTLVATSVASGSAKVLLVTEALPSTWLRKIPNQHDWSPEMDRPPLMVLFSKSV